MNTLYLLAKQPRQTTLSVRPLGQLSLLGTLVLWMFYISSLFKSLSPTSCYFREDTLGGGGDSFPLCGGESGASLFQGGSLFNYCRIARCFKRDVINLEGGEGGYTGIPCLLWILRGGGYERGGGVETLTKCVHSINQLQSNSLEERFEYWNSRWKMWLNREVPSETDEEGMEGVCLIKMGEGGGIIFPFSLATHILIFFYQVFNINNLWNINLLFRISSFIVKRACLTIILVQIALV